VQCGAGRTGTYFAAESYGIAPDAVLFAKGVASGLPLGGIIAGRGLMDLWPTGTHGSTFGGNPVSCAAALATLDVLEDERLMERAGALGTRTMDRLRDELGALDVVRDVRGKGLMVGLELADQRVTDAVATACLDQGVIVLACGPEENVVRLVPALTITDDELDLGLTTLIGAVQAAG
jgi:4-aminobutyrate aminotransferase